MEIWRGVNNKFSAPTSTSSPDLFSYAPDAEVCDLYKYLTDISVSSL